MQFWVFYSGIRTFQHILHGKLTLITEKKHLVKTPEARRGRAAWQVLEVDSGGGIPLPWHRGGCKHLPLSATAGWQCSPITYCIPPCSKELFLLKELQRVKLDRFVIFFFLRRDLRWWDGEQLENSLASWQTFLVSGVKFIGKESLPVSTPICVNAKVGIRTSSCQRQKAENQRNPQGAGNGILNIPLLMRWQGQGKATLPLMLLEHFSALAALLQPSASKFIHKNLLSSLQHSQIFCCFSTLWQRTQ